MPSYICYNCGYTTQDEDAADEHDCMKPKDQEGSGMSKEVAKWADDFMFEAEPQRPEDGPKAFLLNAPNDPLGAIAAAAMAYEGKFVKSLAEVTDEQRRKYLTEVRKTALAMPLEAVQFMIRITGVTRGFTHQMVRQRTAAYSQESTRFAVKTGVPVGLPPSLAGTNPNAWVELVQEAMDSLDRQPVSSPEQIKALDDQAVEFAERNLGEADKWRMIWEETIAHIEVAYQKLVDAGMPAEDARGLLPTNLLTQINYITNLRNFQTEAGKRLCTQAQFEWRLVLSKIIEAMRNYGKGQSYQHTVGGVNGPEVIISASEWQFRELAGIFRPVCYLEGKCPFKASFDRKCSIRDRVDANAAANRPPEEWNRSWVNPDNLESEVTRIETGVGYGLGPIPIKINAIHPSEWLLDPGAAR